MATKVKAKEKDTKPVAAATRRPAAQPERTPTPPAVRNARAGAVGAVIDYGQFGRGAGLEDADRESFAIPFLQVLQKMSPQLDRNHASYIKNAKEGDFFNTATQDVYDGEEGILVIPVRFKRSYTSWIIREKGGGFKGEYPTDDPVVRTTTEDTKGRQILPNTDIQLVDTRLHGVLLLNGDVGQPALMSLTSTQLKKSKRWNTQQDELSKSDGMPIFAHVYKIITVPESNDKGSWMGILVEHVGLVEDQEQANAAMGFYTSLASGKSKMRADPGQVYDQQ